MNGIIHLARNLFNSVKKDNPDCKICTTLSVPLIAHTEHTNSTRIVYKGPCLVTGITISGDGAAADCQVYDGQTDREELKFHLEAISGTTFGRQSSFPTDFNKGIYIVVNAGTTHVSIEYAALSRKESL